MSVSLSPSGQLGFPRPLTQLVKRTLSVSNSNSQPVAFKVKTTAPKQYCVRPNSGRIEPGETVEVQVLLQPMKEDPPAGTKCRDKFLVQSVVITPERETASLPELWSAVEKEDKAGPKETASIHEQKIRCAYLAAPEETIPEHPAANGSGFTQAPPGEEDGPKSSNFDTVRPLPTNGSSHPRVEAAFATPLKTSDLAPSTPPETASTPTPSTPTATFAERAGETAKEVVAGVAAAVGTETSSSSSSSIPPAASTPTPTSGDVATLRAKLASANAEIARLKAALSAAETTASTLRSRGAGTGVSSGGAVPGTQQAVVEVRGTEGVPVQVVAGIAFGVFVFTWLFF